MDLGSTDWIFFSFLGLVLEIKKKVTRLYYRIEKKEKEKLLFIYILFLHNDGCQVSKSPPFLQYCM